MKAERAMTEGRYNVCRYAHLAVVSCLVTHIAAITTPQQAIYQNQIKADSKLGSYLLHNGRRLEEEESYIPEFLSSYSIIFLGCQLISEFNAENSYYGRSLVQKKSLARFRLCPESSCSEKTDLGCTSKYGDYVMDMTTAVEMFLQAESNADDGASDFDALDYSQCKLYYNGTEEVDDDDTYYDDFYAYEEGNSTSNSTNATVSSTTERNVTMYIGPYCTGQGGSIRFGVFSDSACKTHLDDGTDLFYQKAGFGLPYSSDSSNSLLPDQCMSCDDDMCNEIYISAGKCESRIDTDYPNDSACSYIQGLSVLKNNGSVFARNTMRRSKAATSAIFVLFILAAFLGLYVFSLKKKYEQAERNLLFST